MSAAKKPPIKEEVVKKAKEPKCLLKDFKELVQRVEQLTVSLQTLVPKQDLHNLQIEVKNLDKLIKVIQTKMPASNKELEFAEKMKRGKD